MSVERLDSYLFNRGLSKREVDIVKEVAKGIPSREVGERLFIVEKTVKFHLTKIYKKLGIKTRSELIVLHRDLCYIKIAEPPPPKKPEPPEKTLPNGSRR